MAKRQFNRRLSDEAIAAINWWANQDSTSARKVTDTEIVERAIALYSEMRVGGVEVPTPQNGVAVAERIAPIQDSGSTGRSVDPATIPGVSVGLPPKPPVIIKRYKCDHCGTSPAVARVGDICEQCQEGGHSGDVRTCPECWRPA